MAFNPNAIFISPSSLSDFEKCPKLYYYRYVYKTPDTGLKIQIINPALALGQAVHDTIERFILLEPSARTKSALDTIFATVWQGLSGEKGGFSSTEEEKEYKDRGEAMLTNFFGNNHFLTAQKFKMPEFLKAELGDDLILTGKLDWIEKVGDGYHLVDFKTGKNEEKENSPQLPIYAVLAGKILGTDDIKASYWYLDQGKNLRDFALPDMEEFALDLKRKGLVIKKSRLTNSFVCPKGESCWACRDMVAVIVGKKGKLVSVDSARKQEIYILPKEETKEEAPEELPF